METFASNLLHDKVAFVTGGGSGINLAVAQRFASAGARVALLGRTQEKLDAAVATIGADSAIGLSADVPDYAGVAERLRETQERWGEIDLLVCGAAGNFPAPALGMSANGFKSVVDIDLLGTFNTCRAAFEHLRKPGASIISISAPQGSSPTAFQAHVCAAKAGVDMVTRVLAIEWGGAGVRVNAISPGPIEETEGMKRLAPNREVAVKLAQQLPLGRFGQKSEIADLALFLASDASRYITGVVIPCDGGQSLLGSGKMMDALT
jgi:NAD(P)-dependent dehydrogenase (short-subunit alcohol dehydrogenase family)